MSRKSADKRFLICKRKPTRIALNRASAEQSASAKLQLIFFKTMYRTKKSAYYANIYSPKMAFMPIFGNDAL